MQEYHKVTLRKKKTIENVIRRALKKYSRKGFLYGSFISRDYFHDIDLIIMGSIDEKIRQKLEKELNKQTGFEIEIKFFDELPLTFKFCALEQGKPLFDSKEFQSIKFETIRHYLDFQPFKTLIDKRILR